jgi:hypothetical protein
MCILYKLQRHVTHLNTRATRALRGIRLPVQRVILQLSDSRKNLQLLAIRHRSQDPDIRNMHRMNVHG